MEMSKEDLQDVIEKAVEKALDTLGLDVTERNELRRDFIYLRTRRQESEGRDEVSIATEVLDREWVSVKRVKEARQREFIQNHIYKFLALGALALIGYALFGVDVMSMVP